MYGELNDTRTYKIVEKDENRLKPSSGFRFKHHWWLVIISPFEEKSENSEEPESVIKNRKPQASHTYVCSEPPDLSGFRSYLGHGALSSLKSTTGGFLGGKLGWSNQAL